MSRGVCLWNQWTGRYGLSNGGINGGNPESPKVVLGEFEGQEFTHKGVGVGLDKVSSRIWWFLLCGCSWVSGTMGTIRDFKDFHLVSGERMVHEGRCGLFKRIFRWTRRCWSIEENMVGKANI
jgi:hypothetical protein